MVKVMTSTSCPSACSWRAKRSLNAANPPRKGYAVPSITMRIDNCLLNKTRKGTLFFTYMQIYFYFGGRIVH